MQVGDLVRLNPEFFGGSELPEDIGILVKRLQPHRGEMFLVLWNDGNIERFHEEDLILQRDVDEKKNENR